MLYVSIAAACSFLAGSAPAVRQRTAEPVVNMVAVRSARSELLQCSAAALAPEPL